MKNSVEKPNRDKAEKDSIQIRIDKNLKKIIKETIDMMWLDFTTAINLFFRKVNTEQAIPFQIAVDNGFNSKEEKVVIKTKDELEEMENE